MKKWVLILALITSFNTFASEYIPCTASESANGTCFNCGATCVARYSESIDDDENVKGTLTISGRGDMSFEPKYPLFTTLEGPSGSFPYNGYYQYDSDKGRWRTDAPWRDLDRSITNVVIEDGITSIAAGSFYRVTSLTNVSIPDSVTRIGNAAFQNDRKLTNAELPANLKQIGHAAFYVTSIEYFAIPEGFKKNNGSDYQLSNNKNQLGSVALKGIVIDRDAYFDKDMLLGANLSNIESIYCEKSNINCQSLKDDNDLKNKLIFYDKQSDGNSMLKCNGKTYQSINDLLKGNYDVHRIYTIEEANFVAGKTNTFSIRYR